MKLKTINVVTCTLLFNLLVTSVAMSQQSRRPANTTAEQMPNGPAKGNYTYRLFIAPDKSFGYYILQNGRVISRGPAFLRSTINNEKMLTKKEEADIAALLTIEKLKNGLRPELTKEELIKITAR